MTEAGIVRATGLKRPEVKTALTVARSEVARKAADRWEFLTLTRPPRSMSSTTTPRRWPPWFRQRKDNPSQLRPRCHPAPHHPSRTGSQGRIHRRARSTGDHDLRRPAPRAVDHGPERDLRDAVGTKSPPRHTPPAPATR